MLKIESNQGDVTIEARGKGEVILAELTDATARVVCNLADGDDQAAEELVNLLTDVIPFAVKKLREGEKTECHLGR